ILLIIISTIFLLVCTGYASQLLVTKSLFPSKEKNEETSRIGG
ncbi:MAG: antiholin LrgA, partial [Staphylococcus warneri]|nr:antiholin LrgA [Staphylococcus warneri]